MLYLIHILHYSIHTNVQSPSPSAGAVYYMFLNTDCL